MFFENFFSRPVNVTDRSTGPKQSAGPGILLRRLTAKIIDHGSHSVYHRRRRRRRVIHTYSAAAADGLPAPASCRVAGGTIVFPSERGVNRDKTGDVRPPSYVNRAGTRLSRPRIVHTRPVHDPSQLATRQNLKRPVFGGEKTYVGHVDLSTRSADV